MKRTRVGVSVLFILHVVVMGTLLAARAREKPDLSGTWILNSEKSRLQITAKIDRATFIIEHQELSFKLSRVFLINGREDSLTWTLTTDGREKVTVEEGRTNHSRLFWDGEVLVLDVRIVLKDGREATNVVRYSLRDGGRTFVAEEEFRGPRLKYDNLWVAERKI
jgi:hypothetical protein